MSSARQASTGHNIMIIHDYSRTPSQQRKTDSKTRSVQAVNMCYFATRSFPSRSRDPMTRLAWSAGQTLDGVCEPMTTGSRLYSSLLMNWLCIWNNEVAQLQLNLSVNRVDCSVGLYGLLNLQIKWNRILFVIRSNKCSLSKYIN